MAQTVNFDMFPKSSKITIYSLGVFLGLIHIFLGCMALTPMISQDYHREIRVNFNTFTKSLPFINEVMDRQTLALVLRYFLGLFSTLFGILILENGHYGTKLSQLGNYGLICVNLNQMLMLMSIATPLQRIAPTIVFILLLVTRLVILEQALKAAQPTKGKGSKPKTSTPKKNKNE